MFSIALVGEAWGREEELEGAPFVGASGQELTRMLRDAGISRSEIPLITNVFNFRPVNNEVNSLCVNKKEAGPKYPFPPLSPGHYVAPKYLPELFRLWDELARLQPNLIVAFGNTALWALTGTTGIKSRRGAVTLSRAPGTTGTKVIPTIHPAAVLRDWSSRVLVVADLIKARRESNSPKVMIPERTIWLDPTIDDLYEFERLYIQDFLGCDIETAHGQVLCIGLSPSHTVSLVLPFIDRHQPGYNYWKTPSEEALAYLWLRTLLGSSDIVKLFQNGFYDIQYLWRVLKIKTMGWRLDTMIHHHALQPELPKSLGFMGSLYTSEMSWKNMRRDREEKNNA